MWVAAIFPSAYRPFSASINEVFSMAMHTVLWVLGRTLKLDCCTDTFPSPLLFLYLQIIQRWIWKRIRCCSKLLCRDH